MCEPLNSLKKAYFDVPPDDTPVTVNAFLFTDFQLILLLNLGEISSPTVISVSDKIINSLVL